MFDLLSQILYYQLLILQKVGLAKETSLLHAKRSQNINNQIDGSNDECLMDGNLIFQHGHRFVG
jgi:hypothetical protein